MAVKKTKKKVAVKRVAKRTKTARAPRKGRPDKVVVKMKKPNLVHRRPKVTAEEKLYLLFKDDYEARQVFAYLRVETVGELEQYAPEQIIDLLTKPLQETVGRIREKLAEKYRRLAGDDAYLAKYLETHDED